MVSIGLLVLYAADMLAANRTVDAAAQTVLGVFTAAVLVAAGHLPNQGID